MTARSVVLVLSTLGMIVIIALSLVAAWDSNFALAAWLMATAAYVEAGRRDRR